MQSKEGFCLLVNIATTVAVKLWQTAYLVACISHNSKVLSSWLVLPLLKGPGSLFNLGIEGQSARKTVLLGRGYMKGCVWLQAVAVESNENGQLTDRLAAHALQAPVLDAWLAKFPTLRQGLPAHQTLPEVATAVDAVAKRILASKAAATAIKVPFVPFVPSSFPTACCHPCLQSVTFCLLLESLDKCCTSQGYWPVQLWISLV